MKNLRPVGILGVGHYAPEKILTNKDLEKMVNTTDEWITERTGIKERHIAAPGENTSDMAVAAARRALEHAGVKPEEIDLIVMCTLSGDYPFPATGCLVQDKLGAVNAGAFDLAAGCSGFIYGLSVASQMVATGSMNKVLVIGAEILSRVINWEDRNTCVLFADGAGAAVIGPVEEGYGFYSYTLGSDGSGGEAIIARAGGTRTPVTEEILKEKLHLAQMDGTEVFKFASRIMPEAINTVLAKSGLQADDIDIYIPHQANVRIIQSGAKRLKQPLEKFFINVQKYGNTSAGSVPIALSEAWDEGRIKKGDNVLLVGFGTGLTWAACALKWNK